MLAIKRDRAGALAAAGAIHVALIYLLITGLGIDVAAKVSDAIQLIEVGPPPPPPIVVTPRPLPKRAKKREGEAAPPNLKSVATPVVAPPPVIRLPVPPPVTAAVTPGIGAQATQGAAEVPGPGTGSGGIGNGTGSGGQGDGDGGGGDGGNGGRDEETPPRWIRGRLKDSDYPRGVSDSGISGRVSVRYLVDEDGRVARCSVTRSSGSPELDETTCRLIQQRFRFEPSRDARGDPVAATIVESHEWLTRDDPDGR